MEAKELRIGNLIKCLNTNNGLDIALIVDSISFGLIGCYDIKKEHCHFYGSIEKVYPIPLTEEWLVKFGFKNDNFYNTYALKEYCIDIKDGEFNVMNDPCSSAGCYYLTTIKYVHQLQNLYFALTGEELELKQ